MAENITSQTQHIAALDFDITQAVRQLEQLQSRVEEITNLLNSQNWSVNATISGENGVRAYADELVNAQNRITELEEEIANMREQMEQTEQVGVQATSVLVGMLEHDLVDAFRNAASAAKQAAQDVEDSMMDISRVLDLNSEQTLDMKSQMFDLANEFGRSFGETADVTLRFAQAGYNMQDSLSMTRDALLAVNTAELDSEQATQSLIGILNQWGYSADDLITVIDKLNYTADNNAITTQDLVDSLLKASSVAKVAGMSFDDTVGILTSMKVASGAAGKEVGNAFKSILSYIQRPDSLKLFDNMGIEVYADKATGALNPMMDILEQMSEKWNSGAEAQNNMIDTLVQSGDAAQMMSEEWAIASDSVEEYAQYQQAAAEATDLSNTAEARAQANAAAGVYRRNYYISLMENFAEAVEVSDDLINAEGHSMKENGRYMDTLTAKTEQLVSSLTELAVTAADAGLMDLAKECIDTATAFTQWTSDSKNLIPILTTLVSLIVTIRAQRIADEFHAIGGAFRNAYESIRSGTTALTSMITTASATTATLGTATTAATGLSAAIGGISLAISAVSAAVVIINSITTAINKARQEAIDTGKETSERLNNLDELKEKYDELKATTERTASQEEEYKDIQEQIIDLLGDRAAKLKTLKEGTEEYTKALEELTSRERVEQQSELDDAVRNAKSAMNSNWVYFKKSPDINISDNSAGTTLYDNGLTEYNNGSYELALPDDMLGKYETLKNAIAVLNDEHERLIKNGEIEAAEAEAFTSSSSYQAVIKTYNDCKTSVEDYVSALVAQKENEYIIRNGIPQTYAEQVKMNDVIYFATGLSDSYRDSVNSLVHTYYTASDAQRDFLNILKTGEYSDTGKKLEDLAKSGELNETMFQDVTGAADGLNSKINLTGMNVKECVDYLNSLYGSSENAAGGAEDLAEVLGLTDDELKALAAGITNAESSISSLNKMMQTLSEGGSLTAEQVMELCDTYGLLASQFTETENGYKIEISALESLRDAQIQTAKVKREQQAYDTLITKNNIIERCRAYGIEIASLANVAEAEAAVVQLRNKINENNRGVNSAADGAAAYAKNSEIQPLLDSINQLRDTYANIDSLADGLYQNLGTSSSKTTSSVKETDDTLKNLIDSINRLGEMGVYSTSELIDKFEELRRTSGYTKEQIQSIEDELHKLYTTQIEENLKATEQEYKDYVQSVKDKYDEDKEALKSMLDDEKEAFKEAQSDEKDARTEYWSDEIDKLKDNLNAQIDSSKAAYEAKKKLTEKSYDNQNEALNKLKDNEINNIKDTYNAQIDALNKIKAARNSERKEEDYQDKRSELLEELSYWEQRTGTDAVEKIAEIKKEIADLDRDRKRELEDEDIDNQIDDLEDKRDKETAAVEKAYDNQIAALKNAKTSELEIYESTYNAEQEMLKNKLDADVKAMEKARDADLKALEKKQAADLKLLEQEQEKKLKALEDEKDAAIKAAEEKWNEIEKLFTDFNISVIASAAEFAPELYNQFHTLFTERFKMDLDEIKSSISQMDTAVSSSSSGVKPTGKAANSSGYVANPASSGGSSSSNSFKVGSSVKVSGTTYTDSSGSKVKIPSVSGEKGSVTSIKSGTSKPYRIDDLGWVDKSSLVKARTGGLTTADGLAMLHKDELIINPELVKGLKAIVDPQMLEGFKRVFMPETYGNVSNNYNNTRNYNNGRSIIFNAPLQNIEKVEDAADMEAATRSIERKLLKKVNSIM